MLEDPKEIEVGLRVWQTDQGFFGVYQTQTGDELLIAETKERPKEQKADSKI